MPTPTQEKPDFSVVLGGPLYHLYRRTHLLRPPLDLLPRRVVAFAVVTWIPLFLLCAAERHLVGGVAVPFLFDLDVHAKLLISLSMLVAAEPVVHMRMGHVVDDFAARGLIAPDDRARLDATVVSALRVRNSVVVEIALLVLAFTFGHWFWRSMGSLHTATWYALHVKGTPELTRAGTWYALVSMPIVRFVLFRWYYRIFVWYFFLFRMSRLPLRLNSLHPDRMGGLGFLGQATLVFVPVLMAQTVFLSGFIGNQIWHQGARLPQFKMEMLGIVTLVVLVALAPLAFFVGPMARARQNGIREYGTLGSRYVREFREKWIEPGEAPSEPLLGSADLQSLADLANESFIVGAMRVVPFSKELFLRVVVLTAAPLAPLVLTMFPLEQLLDRIVQMVL